MCFPCVTFFGYKDECDTDIPNSSQISYRHHVPAATLLCLNAYRQYVLSSMANFNKFCSELWLLWKQVSEEWNKTIWISQLKERLLPYLMPESPRGKKHCNYINHGQRLNRNLHIFVHQSIRSKTHRKLKFVLSYVHTPIFVFKLWLTYFCEKYWWSCSFFFCKCNVTESIHRFEPWAKD